MFLFLMTSVRLCCLIAPCSRRFLFIGIQTQQHATVMHLLRPFPCEKRSEYIRRLSCHWESTGNANTSQEIYLTATCLPGGFVLILFAVSSYPAHRLPKNTASFVILSSYIVPFVQQICSYAVISTPQIN